jgi:protein gp37
MDPAWPIEIQAACEDQEVAFFFKQWGGRTPKAGGRTLLDRTWDEMPTASQAVSELALA